MDKKLKDEIQDWDSVCGSKILKVLSILSYLVVMGRYHHDGPIFTSNLIRRNTSSRKKSNKAKKSNRGKKKKKGKRGRARVRQNSISSNSSDERRIHFTVDHPLMKNSGLNKLRAIPGALKLMKNYVMTDRLFCKRINAFTKKNDVPFFSQIK